MSNDGRKDDLGKLRFDLIPWPALVAIVSALTYGANKYGDDNWMRVPDGRKRYLAALLRHVVAYAGGETHDRESGIHHLGHAGACLLFLLSDLTGDE